MRASVLAILLVAAALAGCIGTPDDDTPTPDPDSVLRLLAGPARWADPQNAPHPAYNWPTLTNPPEGAVLPAHWAPINGTGLPASITGLAHVTQSPSEVVSGAGIALFGSLAYVPGFSGKSYILDISDPTRPAVLSEHEVDGSERGAAIIAHPDGRLTVAVSTGPGFNVWDVTDPTAPELASQVTPSQGGHKLGVVPGTPIVYNANSRGGGLFADMGTGVTEIYDLSDPAAPVHVQDFPNGFGCHHIYFWTDPAENKSRAVCAGIEFAQIWDIADPLDPVVIVNVPIPHGVTALPSPSVVPVVTPFAHFSVLSQDGTKLIVGDEFGGGGLPPGCAAAVHTPVGSVSTPVGALWFYDVSDETNPMLEGWFSPGHHIAQNPDHPLTSCTAHHGRLVPDPDGRDLLAMAFYGAGVVLVDFTDPLLPLLVDQWNEGTDTWEVWYYDGYLFTGDLARGLDVLQFS